MAITWNCDDNDRCILAGTNNDQIIEYRGVIQRPDGRGGYNTVFGVTGRIDFYHIHFNRRGLRVRAVRYFPREGVDVEGTNICVDNSDQPMTFRQILFHELDEQNWPNHRILFNRFRAAIAEAGRRLDNELE